ncbi:Asp-tRNA(Asn)/Glu-tRNA(Gln) amidotransferase subunit GatA [bacterium]|nr:MAG: Asp-tRNA(Asn)/Glu-tRNA(Gln) amidotransferase subunit GatA [bacterium]
MKPFITVKELQSLLAKKEVSPQEVVAFFQARINKYNPSLNSILETFDLDAQTVEQATASNGPLAGIPYILKDNISQHGRTTSAGSNILQNYRATYDATVHARLKNAGGLSLGRANMDEFAMGGSGEFSAYGPTKNPWDPSRIPGGSSSGSAAAVAAGLIPFALGTETGGSIRLPAAFTGLVGMYPTYGHNSRYGVLAFASSTDQAGPLTKTVYDNALINSILSGKDEHDASSLQIEKKDYTKNLTGTLPKGLRIGILRDVAEHEGINEEIRASFQTGVKHLESLGATIKEVSLPHLKYGNAVYFVISRVEAASNLSRYDGSLYGNRNKDAKTLQEMYLNTRHDKFGDEVKRRILTGNYALSSKNKGEYYNTATHVRNIIRAEFMAAFNDVDLIVSPTSPTFPFKIGEVVNDPITMYLADYFWCQIVSLAPQPCHYRAAFQKLACQLACSLWAHDFQNS